MGEWSQIIADSKPKTTQDIKELRNAFDSAIKSSPPYGFKASGTLATLDKVFLVENSPTPHDPKIPEMYKQMRKLLTWQKQNKWLTEDVYEHIDDAVLTSAAWYWKNVEKPALGISNQSQTNVSTQHYGISKEEMDKKSKKAKIVQWGIIIGSVGVGFTLLYFAFRKPKTKPKKSNPRLPLKRQNDGVTRSRVRKNTRNQKRLNASGRKPIIIRSNRPSAVGAYRKKYNGSQRKNRPARKTGRLRLRK